MKMIGLIGGTSYESMTTYYKMINRRVNEILGGHHSAKLVLVNLNFDEIVPAFYDNRWSDIEKIMINAAQQLKRAGADFIAVCCNTLHKVVPAIENAVNLPLLHILDATGQEAQKKKIDKIGLLGTKFTMTDTFHRAYLRDRFQIESITPHQQEILNTIIFNELCYGIVKDESKKIFLDIINSLEKNGAQGIVLGCTELFMLLPSKQNLRIPVFDTTALHIDAIVDYALQKESISDYQAQAEMLDNAIFA